MMALFLLRAFEQDLTRPVKTPHGSPVRLHLWNRNSTTLASDGPEAIKESTGSITSSCHWKDSGPPLPLQHVIMKLRLVTQNVQGLNDPMTSSK
jgi:hypothetical protein